MERLLIRLQIEYIVISELLDLIFIILVGSFDGTVYGLQNSTNKQVAKSYSKYVDNETKNVLF